jgi:hypothetical protein
MFARAYRLFITFRFSISIFWQSNYSYLEEKKEYLRIAYAFGRSLADLTKILFSKYLQSWDTTFQQGWVNKTELDLIFYFISFVLGASKG